MDINKKSGNTNNFNDTMNFNGTTQIATGDIINYTVDNYPKKATYTPEPIWRSPFTMAILSWSSVVIGIVGLFPLGKIVKCVMDFFRGNIEVLVDSNILSYLILFIVLLFLFTRLLALRRIAKKQIRTPLFTDFAISGYGKKLTLEKIHSDKCPECGGEMKYYYKPVEWREILHSDGRTKREITKKVPALECKRNAKHWYAVDPAEDKIK